MRVINVDRNKGNVKSRTALAPESLKRTIDYTQFEFETTEEVPELSGIVGQERGAAVMRFGLQMNKVGYNLYVSGISGIWLTISSFIIFAHVSAS